GDQALGRSPGGRHVEVVPATSLLNTVTQPAEKTRHPAKASSRAVKSPVWRATTGPRLAPTNRMKPVSAIPLPRSGAASRPNRVIIAGTATATPVTNTRLATVTPARDCPSSASPAIPAAAREYPARAVFSVPQRA